MWRRVVGPRMADEVDALQGLGRDALELAQSAPEAPARLVEDGGMTADVYHAQASLRSCSWCPYASLRGPCGRHPSRADAGPRRGASATPARSPPLSRHRPATPGGPIPSPPSPGAPLLLWPPSRPALCGTPRAS